MWFTGVEVEQETSAPRPTKNPGSAPVIVSLESIVFFSDLSRRKAVSKAKRNEYLTMVLTSGKISSYAPVNEKRFFELIS